VGIKFFDSPCVYEFQHAGLIFIGLIERLGDNLCI